MDKDKLRSKIITSEVLEPQIRAVDGRHSPQMSSSPSIVESVVVLKQDITADCGVGIRTATGGATQIPIGVQKVTELHRLNP